MVRRKTFPILKKVFAHKSLQSKTSKHRQSLDIFKGDYIVNSFLTNHEEGPRGMGGPENQISQTTQDDQVKGQV